MDVTVERTFDARVTADVSTLLNAWIHVERAGLSRDAGEISVYEQNSSKGKTGLLRLTSQQQMSDPDKKPDIDTLHLKYDALMETLSRGGQFTGPLLREGGYSAFFTVTAPEIPDPSAKPPAFRTVIQNIKRALGPVAESLEFTVVEEVQRAMMPMHGQRTNPTMKTGGQLFIKTPEFMYLEEVDALVARINEAIQSQIGRPPGRPTR